MDETKTVKDDKEAEPDIDPAAQQISQEFEVLRQGSVVQPVQPSPTYLHPEKVIQQLESAADKEYTPKRKYSIVEDLDNQAKQHKIDIWSIFYKPTEAFKKTLQEQLIEVIKAFTNWYRERDYPPQASDKIVDTLNEVINKYSDQFRTPQQGPSRIERLTQKATEAAKAFTSEVVAPLILGDLYPKKSTPVPPLDRKSVV